MKFGAIIAARSGSRRLPGKAILPLFGFPMIQALVKRLKTSHELSEIVFATTQLPEDDQLARIAEEEQIPVFRGSENNVLDRYVQAAKGRNFEYGSSLKAAPWSTAQLWTKCFTKYPNWTPLIL